MSTRVDLIEATSREAAAGVSPIERVREAVEDAAHLLPAQGPIPVFIHHNTLHALEDLPFAEAVKRAAKTFGCQPYLGEDRYRDEMARGRIRFVTLEAVLGEDLGPLAGHAIAGLCTRLDLRRAMLQYPLRFGPTAELLWFIAETDALRRVRADSSAAVRGRLIAETRHWVMRDLREGAGPCLPDSSNRHAQPDLRTLIERFGESRIETWSDDVWEAFTLQALWRVCERGVSQADPGPALRSVPGSASGIIDPGYRRHRDLLLQATGADTDLLVHDVLIRFCAALLDQGLAHWALPHRDGGFCRAFCAMYMQPFGPPHPWLRGLGEQLRRLEGGAVGPLESIRESLDALGVAAAEWDDFLSATMLALRGWAGMIRFLEERGDRAIHAVAKGSLTEFLAIRLLLDRLALAHMAREYLGFSNPLAALRDELARRVNSPRPPTDVQRAFLVFQLAQVLGWTPEDLFRISRADWTEVVAEIEAFSAIERRRIFHLAYERRLYTRTLDAITLHAPTPVNDAAPPCFQAIFCIDEREESFRRHIEELAPDAATFGVAGFFALAIYYRGVRDAHFVPLCPAMIRPRHWVVEKVADDWKEAHARGSRIWRAWGMTTHQFHVGSRTFAVGALLSAAVGVFASVPLIARTLRPRLTARIGKLLARFVHAPAPTRLQIERVGPTPGPDDAGVGFTVDELTDAAERMLREIGLTSGFARLVFVFGHGSTSMNNPHESAHDCGACGGAAGGPNARAIAQALNDPRVRRRLAARGLAVPAGTAFVGGMHNTSNEAVLYYDLDRLPDSHRAEFEAARELIEQAADRDAHERCRRFQSAPLALSYAAARRHVEARAEDLAQVRPEWGHATNAICVVGRRRRTRGLFLDRRAFLSSYDPSQDDIDGTILTAILQAVVPVCAGISLEYYFSVVDNIGFGCGTKLPHNIAALLGVMDGAASDLRTGLPWQMVEIHEPVRILFVVEAKPETLLKIMEREPGIGRQVRNEWVRLAALDPDSPIVSVYRNGGFYRYEPRLDRLPRTTSSVEWYRGWRDHLEFAEIG
jgi:uncharacterized protein YbcC (UPF0753/DUF2309 family)